jgi:hypothetical protein
VKTAVIVVHGVGDPLPGDALGSLVDGLAGTTGFRESTPRRTEFRSEPGDAASGAALVSTFPVTHAVLLRAPSPAREPSTLHIREVYWGDLARVKRSLAALIYALFDLIFGLRHVVFAAQDVASSMASKTGRVTRFCVCCGDACSEVALWIARGPLFALNLLAASVGILAFLLAKTLPQATLAAPYLALGGAAAVALVACLIRGPLRRKQWSRTTADSLLVVGAIAALLALRWQPSDAGKGVMEFIDHITTAMSFFAVLMAMAAILMTLANVTAMLSAPVEAPRPLQEVEGDGPKSPAPCAPLVRPLTVVNFCTLLAVGLFVFVAMVAWTVVAERTGAAEQARIVQGLHLFAFVWGAFILAAAMFVAVLTLNGYLNFTRSRAERHRYIVSPAVVFAFTVASLIYGGLFIPLAASLELVPVSRCYFDEVAKVCDCNPLKWNGLCEFRVGLKNWDDPLRAAAIAASGVLVLVFVATRAHFATALDLVLDAIAHFKRDDENVLGFRRRSPRPAKSYPLWESILARFDDVLQSTIADMGDGEKRIVVLSHSQGTTIALAGLGLMKVDGALRTPTFGGVQVDLVTMGSPVDHLYRYYMRTRYSLPPDAGPRGMRWINVYRIDDFIGTRIDTATSGHPMNLAVDPRGHTDYWRDREVLEHLVPFVLGRAT